jgi:hypothetical protein
MLSDDNKTKAFLHFARAFGEGVIAWTGSGSGNDQTGRPRRQPASFKVRPGTSCCNARRNMSDVPRGRGGR